MEYTTMLNTRKLTSMIAALALCVAVASPALALGEEPGSDHGPIPMAIFHTMVGATFFAISVPFTALIAPRHIMQSFDELVMDPWRVTIGAQEDRR
jgi:hypothetical protein